jgi:UDPglucose 6-dehydrogenase
VKSKIGILGMGFVGSSVYGGLKDFHDIETHDIDKNKESSQHDLAGLVRSIDEIVFVCLPTPMKKNGRCDTGIVEAAIREINEKCALENKRLIAVIKSTIEPGTTRDLNDKYKYLDIVFNPEFLTEANALRDFVNQNRIIIGGCEESLNKVESMYREAFPKVPIIKTDSMHAEMVKYFTNCFLATKVSFANEMYEICSKSGLDYDKIVEYALYDRRLGRSHFSCPGPDGKYGFGGHCLPKDLNALIAYTKSLEVYPMLLFGVWERNLDSRKREDRDWEKMIGRAVSREE